MFEQRIAVPVASGAIAEIPSQICPRRLAERRLRGKNAVLQKACPVGFELACEPGTSFSGSQDYGVDRR